MEAHQSTTLAEAASASGAERRCYTRLVFSPMDGVTAGLALTTPTSAEKRLPIQAMVMTLSRGGLGMGIPRDEMGGQTLVEGDRFEVVELRIAYRQMRLALTTQAEIRWAIDADYLDHLCFGCAFTQPGDPLGQRLARFVADNFPSFELG
jgi:hypothetical protein